MIDGNPFPGSLDEYTDLETLHYVQSTGPLPLLPRMRGVPHCFTVVLVSLRVAQEGQQEEALLFQNIDVKRSQVPK